MKNSFRFSSTVPITCNAEVLNENLCHILAEESRQSGAQVDAIDAQIQQGKGLRVKKEPQAATVWVDGLWFLDCHTAARGAMEYGQRQPYSSSKAPVYSW